MPCLVPDTEQTFHIIERMNKTAYDKPKPPNRLKGISINKQVEKGRKQRGLCWLGTPLKFHHTAFLDTLACSCAHSP